MRGARRAPAATAADRLVERGIVQSADRAGLVLRALDGTEVTVARRPSDRFRLNGRPASLADIRSGFVAEAVTLVPGGPAAVVRAFGRVAGSAEAGRLVEIRPRALVVRRDAGGTVRIPVTARTNAWRCGWPHPVAHAPPRDARADRARRRTARHASCSCRGPPDVIRAARSS